MLEELDRSIADRSEAAFALLESLVGAPSLVGAEQAALETFAHEAEALGLVVERLPLPARSSTPEPASPRTRD
jgi:acetylornithine deacetylase